MTDEQSPFEQLGLPEPTDHPNEPEHGPSARKFLTIAVAVSAGMFILGMLAIVFIKPGQPTHYAGTPETPAITEVVKTDDVSSMMVVTVPAYSDSLKLVCTPKTGEPIVNELPATPDPEATSKAGGKAARYLASVILTSSTDYSCDVTAREGKYVSAASNTVRITTEKPRDIPAAPETFSHQVRAGKLYLTWPASDGATSYWVQRATNADFTTDVTDQTVTTPHFVDDVKPGVTYYYRVSSRNAGSASAVSNVPYKVTIPAAGASTDSAPLIATPTPTPTP